MIYSVSNKADITITENATFDLENNISAPWISKLDGTDYNGGDIIVGSFNVTAGKSRIL